MLERETRKNKKGEMVFGLPPLTILTPCIPENSKEVSNEY